MERINHQVIWKDKFDSIIFLAYFFCFFTFFLIGILSFNGDMIGNRGLKENMDKIIPITLIGGLSSSLAIYYLSKRTFIVLLNKGIILDNIKFVRVSFFSKTNIKIVSRRNFVEWKDIDALDLENHEKRGGRLAEIIPFLMVKTKKEKYQAHIEDVLGFVEALKKLNKYNLLTKEALEFIKKYQAKKRH